jgi:S1-C subfamily serine protease
MAARTPVRQLRKIRASLILLVAIALLPGARPSRGAPDFQALQERVQTKVVFIDVQIGRGGRGGTGFFASPGRVLTSNHVIRGADRITVWSNGTPYRARVVERDPEQDLALLALPDAALLIKPLSLAAAETTKPGEEILIVGSHPAPTAAVVRQSLIPGQFRGPTWFQWPAHRLRTLEITAHVEPGDSGSPVLRLRDGAVIGVVRARETAEPDGTSGRVWAVPIDLAFPLLRHASGQTQQAIRPNPDEEYYLRQP